MREARTIGISIQRPLGEVYEFARVPENFPTWASGFASALREQGAEWVAETPDGLAKVRFSEPNPFGVLDHHVTLPSRDEISIPLRVVANGDGSEVIFTLFRLPEMTDEAFERDVGLVTNDLNALKALLEG